MLDSFIDRLKILKGLKGAGRQKGQTVIVIPPHNIAFLILKNRIKNINQPKMKFSYRLLITDPE